MGLAILTPLPPPPPSAMQPVEAPARRRLTSKQPCCAALQQTVSGWAAAEAAGLAAVAAEGWSELTALDPDARRQHVHWTHVHTNNSADRQPESFTRAEFFDHLCKVYREVYPEPANATGSILLFGAVAKEKHSATAELDLRAEHHHAPTFCSKRHLWRAVAQRSHRAHNVKLHAACHDGYASMYAYIVQPSSRKPLAELDPEVFLSPEHPRGDVLRRLLEAGSVSARGLARRRARAQDRCRQTLPSGLSPLFLAGFLVAAALG